jgi:flagellar L-ring protein precursor FlgH
MRIVLATAVIACLGALSGCATVMGDVRPFPDQVANAPGASAVPPGYAQPAYGQAPAAVAAPGHAQPVAGDGGGSIFASATDGSGNRGIRLFQDNKAREVGDLLTIVLVESTNAKSNAKTGISKDSDIAMGAPTILGQGVTYHGKNLLQAEVDAKRGFNGAGDTQQSNSLDGDVTVTVVQRLGNGNLRVSGQKQLRLNQGDELVQVQGIVRVADIGPDNRITSDRVGNAQIVYGGRGAVARSNAMGWLGRFFNSAAAPY